MTTEQEYQKMAASKERNKQRKLWYKLMKARIITVEEYRRRLKMLNHGRPRGGV